MILWFWETGQKIILDMYFPTINKRFAGKLGFYVCRFINFAYLQENYICQLNKKEMIDL